jgi:ABC-type methionine transport system ATPase subunit
VNDLDKQRAKFTFPTALVTQPIIYNLGQKFDVITNIRRADVRDEMGWVILELEGPQDEIQRGVAWVSSLGVRVDPIAGDVVEG